MISPTQMKKLYGLLDKKAKIIHYCLGISEKPFSVKEIAHKTGISEKEVVDIVFSNNSSSTIQLIRQFLS